MTTCLCGCGQSPKQSWRKYCKGHWARTAESKQMQTNLRHKDIAPNPSGLCMCGCGLPTNLALQSDSKRGWVNGQPMRFLSGHATRVKGATERIEGARRFAATRKGKTGPKGPQASNWKGGRTISRGYIYVYTPENSMADKRGYVREHRLVMSQQIGRSLSPSEHVHHINGNKTDNRPENLMLLSSNEHTNIHRSQGSLRVSRETRIHAASKAWQTRRSKSQETMAKP